MSSADVVVVVDDGEVGVAGVTAVVEVPVLVDPCDVTVVDVVGTLGELGVITVWLVTDDDPGGVDVVDLFVVSSAKDSVVSVVVARMLALTIKNL
jgi:hypothetical protein